MANISTQLLDTIKSAGETQRKQMGKRYIKGNSWIWDVKQSVDSWSRLSIDTRFNRETKTQNLTMDLRKPPPFPTFTKQQADPTNKNRTFTSKRSRQKPKSELGFR